MKTIDRSLEAIGREPRAFVGGCCVAAGAVVTAVLVSVAPAIVSPTPAEAVEPNLPSKTALWVTAARAVGTHDPDPAVRNPDWLAEQLLGPAERGELGGNYMIDALASDYRSAMAPGARPRMYVLSVTVRTRFIDDELRRALAAGVHQVVNLAAGYDTRAYRFRDQLAGTRIYELDYGPTQEYKRQRIEAIAGAPPPGLVYVPIDFRIDQLADRLSSAGYDASLQTLFIWEGSSMYLTPPAVDATLSVIASAAAGSAVVFDYIPRSRLKELPATSAPEREIQAMVADWGEPWLFSIDDGRTAEFLAARGLRLEVNLGTLSGKAIARYLTRQDGSRMGDLGEPLPRNYYFVARAIVPTPQL